MRKLAKKNDKANKLPSEFKKIDKTLENAGLVCTKTDGIPHNFNRFFLPLRFIEKIHNYEITLDEAIKSQTELNILINKLNNDYNPRNPEKVKEKKEVLKSAKELLNGRKGIIDLFEKGIFPYRGNVFKPKKELEEKKFLEYIENESKVINYDLFKKYFDFETLTQLAKKKYLK